MNGVAAARRITFELDPSSRFGVLRSEACLDETLAPALRSELYSAIDNGYHDIVVELPDGISSVGIGSLVCGVRRFAPWLGRIALAGCPRSIEPLLRMSGLEPTFSFFETANAAREELICRESRSFDVMRENSINVRKWIRSLAYDKVAHGECDAIEAAASEAFANAVEHAGSAAPVLVTLSLGSSLVVEVQDSGPGFEARQYCAADPDSLHSGARGLGVYVMRNLVEHVEFIAGVSGPAASPRGTTVRLVKFRRATETPNGRSAARSTQPGPRQPSGGVRWA